jgi:hypothetical protein
MDEILHERSGPVDPEHIRQTIEKLREFLGHFNPKDVLPRISDDVSDPGRLLTDPEFPMMNVGCPLPGSAIYPGSTSQVQ